MLFAIVCNDRAGGTELRARTREAHLRYVASFGAQVVSGGPLLDADGDARGSLLIVDMADLAAAERFVTADPYAMAGLFETVTVSGYRSVFMNGERLG